MVREKTFFFSFSVSVFSLLGNIRTQQQRKKGTTVRVSTWRRFVWLAWWLNLMPTHEVGSQLAGQDLQCPEVWAVVQKTPGFIRDLISLAHRMLLLPLCTRTPLALSAKV